jgi:hypothetical protein
MVCRGDLPTERLLLEVWFLWHDLRFLWQRNCHGPLLFWIQLVKAYNWLLRELGDWTAMRQDVPRRYPNRRLHASQLRVRIYSKCHFDDI